jgi:radical SAM protein with 4Fe4S-binding SPASM domain
MLQTLNIDPNGLCNAKCWYCPVAYVGNSKENKTNMSLETMEDIFKQLDEGRGIWTSRDLFNSPIHFNEVLLYPYFEEMLELHKKYNIKISIYTNGVNLTKDKIDLIVKYKKIVSKVLLNVPSLNPEQWSKFAGFNIKIFPKLLENLKYAEEKLVDIFSENDFCIMANGVNQRSLFENGGWIEVMDNAPHYDLDMKNGTLETIVKEMKTLLPKVNIWGRNNLGDRTGVLEDFKVISNQNAIKTKNQGKVISCGAKYPETLFISATGNVFLCAADFKYESIFANIKDKPLKEIWEGVERQNAIKKAYEGMCTGCFRAVKETGEGPSMGKVI